jgi:hypothetical protein
MREGSIEMRALAALGVLVVISAILWVIFSAQPHPLGTLGYTYINSMPGFLATIAIAAAVVVGQMALRRKRK